jgi:hypothetical protein
MEKKKIDRIIQIVRENMTVGVGGFTSAGDQTRAGYDKVQVGMMRRTPPVYAKGGKGSRTLWLNYLKKQKPSP